MAGEARYLIGSSCVHHSRKMEDSEAQDATKLIRQIKRNMKAIDRARRPASLVERACGKKETSERPRRPASLPCSADRGQ